jgi:hypothetical protein
MINDQVTTVDKGIGTITVRGAFSQYNGVDIHQTRDYIKLSCESYIDRVLQTHGWASPDHQQSDRHDQVPLSPSLITTLGTKKGPAENTPEYRDIAAAAGFGYRQVLGELIYAYVVGRLDIGYAVTFLARFSQSSTATVSLLVSPLCLPLVPITHHTNRWQGIELSRSSVRR